MDTNNAKINQEVNIVGDWNGFIDVQGNHLNILIAFEKAEKLSGKISIPAQNVQDFPLSSIYRNNNKITFNMEIPNQKLEFTGEIEDNQIKGTFAQQGQYFPFELKKGKPVAEGNEEDDETFMSIDTTNGKLFGSLVVPEGSGPYPIFVIIPGSGPTDRNGNSSLTPGKNNSLKMLAESLAEQGIASLRYDKRGAGKNITAIVPNQDVRFELFINDAEQWIKTLKEDKRFSKVGVIGHSQGSLVGMIAAKNTDADAFISIAGAGQPIDKVLEKQLSSLPDNLKDESDKILRKLRAGETVPNVSNELQSVFQPEIQSFLMSWMKYDPTEEIQKLTIPVLVINGDNDVQVNVSEANLLHEAKKESKLLIIPKMNHVLKEAPTDSQGNLRTYTDPSIPLANGLVQGMMEFVNQANFVK